MDADAKRRISAALTVERLIEELGRMPPGSQVVFRSPGKESFCFPVTDAEELFPDEHLSPFGCPRGAVRFVEEEDPGGGSAEVVVLS